MLEYFPNIVIYQLQMTQIKQSKISKARHLKSITKQSQIQQTMKRQLLTMLRNPQSREKLLQIGLHDESMNNRNRLKTTLQTQTQSLMDVMNVYEQKNQQLFNKRNELERSFADQYPKRYRNRTIQKDTDTKEENRSSTLPVIAEARKPSISHSKKRDDSIMKQHSSLNFLLDKFIKTPSKKKTNTFQFSLPIKKIKVKKIVQNDNEQSDKILLQNINYHFNKTFAKVETLRISYCEFSEFINKHFVNDSIATYFKYDQVEQFSFFRSMIKEMKMMAFKEQLMICFLTYDANRDGFICQDDIFECIERVDHHSVLMDDIKEIIKFISSNQLKSEKTNLTKAIVRRRTRREYEQNNKTKSNGRTSSINKIQEIQKKEDKLKKFFTLQNEDYDYTQTKKTKKFQINFDVFCLIFTDKLPYLVSYFVQMLSEQNSFRKPSTNEVSQKVFDKSFYDIQKNMKTIESKYKSIRIDGKNQKDSINNQSMSLKKLNKMIFI